jgi:AcrR family transcriptional regulator
MGRKPLLKKRLKRPDKQKEIIEKLTDFFKENRLSENNMDQVAAFLNKSKATIYKYFRSKEQMVDLLISHKIKNIAQFAYILRDEKIEFFERYKLSYELLSNNIADIPNELLIDIQELYPAIYAKIELLIETAAAELKAYYEKGIALGIFNKLNAAILAQNDLMFFQLLSNPQFLIDNKLSMNQAFKDFYQIRCYGLLSSDSN